MLYCQTGGPWCQPSKAAQLAGVNTAILRDWAQHGLVTAIHCPRRHRRYYQPELHVVAEITELLGITAADDAGQKNRRLLAAHVDNKMHMGWR